MTDEEVNRHNEEQLAKHPGMPVERFIILPPVLAELAQGHGISWNGYLIS